MKANESEPQVTCRKAVDDIKSGLGVWLRDESGGCLFIGQMVSGMYAARAWVRLLYGTWEPVVLRSRPGSGLLACGRLFQGGRQAAESARCELLLRSTGADRLVVVMKVL